MDRRALQPAAAVAVLLLLPLCAAFSVPAERGRARTQLRAVQVGQGGLSTADRLGEQLGPTVWQDLGVLAQATGALNLGQGYPDWSPPEFVREAGAKVMALDAPPEVHQYTRTAGHPRLVELLAKRYSAHFREGLSGRDLDPMREVAVTVGATQALYLSLQTLLAPGDEVLVLEPYFDLYIGQIRAAGGVPVPVPMRLKGGAWSADTSALEKAISSRTRCLILNTPHNPTGAVLPRGELERIAAIVRQRPRLKVISDEVYKFIRFAEGGSSSAEEHVHFAALEGMWDRTLTVSSAGKTFSVTGWQVGWIVGPAREVEVAHRILPLVQFNAATPMQEALAEALERAEEPYEGFCNYYAFLRDLYEAKARALRAALEGAGLRVTKGGGGLFLMAEVTHLLKMVPQRYFRRDWQRETDDGGPRVQGDVAFSRYLADEWGVLAVPASAFFEHSAGRAFLRFAFCKKDETIAAAAEKLQAFAHFAEQQAAGEGGGEGGAAGL